MKWRLGVLSFIVVLLAIMGLGEMKEFGYYVQYPAKYGINLTHYDGNLTKEQVYKKFQKLSTENEFVLFKPLWQSNGSQKAFIFGKTHSYLNDERYTNEQKLLTDSPLTGMYYVDKNVDKTFETELTNMGFRYKAAELPWWMAPIEFFLGYSVRTIAVWTLLFVFAVLLFAVKMMYIKKAMVRRSLGRFQKEMWKETLIDFGILSIESILLIGLFALWQRNITSVFVKSFGLLLLVILISLLIVSGITNSLFALNVRFIPAVKVLKNKTSQGLISLVWLAGILVSVFIFSLTANKITHVSKQLSKEIGVLQNWELSKEFAKITWFNKTEEHTDETHKIDNQFMIENGKRNKNFIRSFGKEGVIY